jgi:Leucine-rich repeat (LRR) protein
MPKAQRRPSPLIILSPIILPLLYLSGCSSSGDPATPAEPSLAEQITAVRRGSTDIILLESTPVRDSDLLVLTAIPGLRVLQLDHPGNLVTEAGLADVARLTELEHLRIRGGNIGDEGLKAICEMPNLKILNLPQGKFTDAGLAHLKELPKLQSLRIGSPNVTDRGIAELKEFPSLLRVHLIDIPISDKGLADLEAIPKLESLYLDGAKISDAAVDDLFRKRPNLHVHFNQAHHDRDPNKHEH